jgi:predicted ATPase/DNA-binding CsgD family transcriptional regulator
LATSPEHSLMSNVPRPLTRFIGREDEIESIIILLLRDDVRLVTLTGTGGIGKTRLSIEVAHRMEQLEDWNVCFVSLAVATHADDAMPRIAIALGLWNTQTDDVVRRLIDLVQNEKTLLVLDNLEHIIDIASDLGELLAGTSNLTMLVTSRSPLHIQGEREYSVPQLTTPPPDSTVEPDSLLECEAVALFVDRARAINHEFAITPENGRAIVGICDRLDGLPLAIELAAARTRTLPPATLYARLDNQLGLLRSESRDVPERLRTIRATIDWSYELLSPTEQQTFRDISTFAGDFSLSAAQSILRLDEDETLDTIESLIDKSLLLSRLPLNDEPHFRMLTVVRQFGLEKLQESGEEHAVRLRQAEWAASFAEEMFIHLFGPQQKQALQQVDRLHETIRQSLLWSMDREEWNIAARIGANLWQYWDLYGYLSQGRHWLRRIIQQDRDWARDLIPQLYYGFGILAGSPDDAHENQRLAEAFLEKHEAEEDPRIKAVALNLLGLSRVTQLALRSARDAAEIWKETGDTIWYGLATGLAGRWAREAGDLELSEELSRKSYEILSEAGHVWGAALALLGIGRIHQLRGEIDQAAEIYRKGLADLANLGDRILVLRFLEFLMFIAADKGDLSRAIRIAGAANRLRETMGYHLRYRAEEATVRKFHDDARSRLGSEAFDQAWTTGYRYSIAQAIDDALAFSASEPASESAPGSSSVRLTRREREVLRRIVEGKTDQLIADELFVSYRTITTHVTNILNKLGANTRTEAATIAIRDKLITFES